MKLLLIGDPHATVEELDDCQRLIDLICEVIPKEQPDLVVFLGDQHHNHAVVRVEIIDFWRRAYWRIRDMLHKQNPASEIWCLVGNHDRPGDSSVEAHAMQAYEDLVFPVTQHVRHESGILFLSYDHDPENFVNTCNLYPDFKTLICHQTFDGGRYENGFYAKDGIQVDKIPQPHIISGHIHTPQKFGKVWYPGAPRWRTSSDANVDRHIWAVTFEKGWPVKYVDYATEGYCRKLVEVEDHEGQSEPEFLIKQPVLVTVSVYGSREYVDQKRVRWKQLGYRVRSCIQESATPRVRESDGISVAMQKFVAGYRPKHGTSLETLQKLVGERVHV